VNVNGGNSAIQCWWKLCLP